MGDALSLCNLLLFSWMKKGFQVDGEADEHKKRPCLRNGRFLYVLLFCDSDSRIL
jgi:hypothetical protein